MLNYVSKMEWFCFPLTVDDSIRAHGNYHSTLLFRIGNIFPEELILNRRYNKYFAFHFVIVVLSRPLHYSFLN